MKFFYFIALLVISLLGPASCLSVSSPGHGITSGGPVHALETRALDHVNITVDARAPTHGPPFCNPTGPGVCNMALYNVVQPLGTSPKYGYVYDRYCNEIGFNSVGQGDFSIFSTLPYVVVGNGNTQTFCYAGKCYGNKCIYYYGNNARTVLINQCAFDC